MSGPFGSSQWMYQSAAGFYGYEIDQSLRFEDGDSAFLSRTPASAGNRQVFTISFWVKRANLTDGTLLAADDTVLYFNNDKLRFRFDDGAAELITNMLFRDTSAWYHIVYAVDTTQGTASNRVKLYVNGELITSFSTDERSNLANDNLDINSTPQHRIGRDTGSTGSDFDGYLAEYQIVDGQQLNATDFGETKSGIWIPKAYTGSYGTNGFHLDFADSSTLGNDVSGNNNDFTSSGLASTDQVLDSPTNSFATLNPTVHTSTKGTTAEGNLAKTTGQDGRVGSTFLMSSGKWYWEVRPYNTGVGNGYIGVVDPSLVTDLLNTGGGGFWRHTGAVVGVTPTTSISSWTQNDILGFAYDADNDTIKFYKNGTAQNSGTAYSITNGGAKIVSARSQNDDYLMFNFGQDSTFAGAISATGNTDENGQGDFKYTPPSGYLAMCSANLPDPAIDPNEDETPEDYFNTVLYTGNGTDGRAVNGVGFQPDWLWIKDRGQSVNHVLVDAIRGASKVLKSNDLTSDTTSTDSVKSFATDGFTFGDSGSFSVNINNRSYVAWNWLAGNGTSSNTDGSITSTVSVNTDAGFSIVSYTGNGTIGSTIGHGLDVVPEMIITKNRSSGSSHWAVYFHELGGTERLLLSSTASVNSDNAYWNNTDATSSVFTVHQNIANNASGDNFIAYCFHSVDGYSKLGSYKGNGSSDGAFIYTGFRPAFLLIKRTNGTTDWMIKDNRRPEYNTASKSLRPNQGSAEFDNSNHYIDLLSNGFKCRGTDNMINASGSDYIYMAFAEQPFKYANAR